MENQFNCLCGRSFDKISSLNTHKRFCETWQREKPPKYVRQGLSNPSIPLEERKKIPVDCPSCGKTFKNVYSMSAHMGHCTGRNPPYSERSQEARDRMAWSRGKILASDTDIFCENSRFDTGYAKKALLKRNHREYRCEKCGLDSWLGEDIVLELDHINGDNHDHRFENIRLLCPNCHSQTPTWRGRNKNTGSIKVADEILLRALQDEPSIRQALLRVGLAAKGGNYARCKRLLGQHN